MEGKKIFILALLGVVLITAIVLSPVLTNRFVWDDFEYIVRNETLSKKLPEAIKFYFGQNYFVGNYHPLTMIGFSMEYHHAKLNPEFYHKVNWIIHLLNVVLVFWFIYLLSNKRVLVAAAVALLFGIHPMHVESVAWISELKDVLFAFFYLLALIVYLKFHESSGVRKFLWYSLCFIFFVCSLLSKPAAVSFPLTMLVLDYFLGRKFKLSVVAEKIPYFIGSVIIGLITIKAQDTAVNTLEQFSILERFLLSSYAFLFYLYKLLIPINLSVFHPFPARMDGQFPMIFLISPILVVALAFLFVKYFRNNKWIVFGMLFFMVNIVLVLQFITVGMTVTSERYTYLPYLGLFFIIAMWLSEYLDKKTTSTSTRFIVVGTLIILLVAFAVTSYSRAKVWKSNKTLWNDAAKKYPKCAIAHYNIGAYYFKEEINDALALNSFNNTLKYDPGYIKALVNRGILYTRMKEYAKAETDFNRAIELDPTFAETYKNFGVLHNFIGNYEKAISDYTSYLKLEPLNHDIYFGRGMTYYQLKQYQNAADDFSKAIDLESGKSQYWLLKAMSLQALGQKEEAMKSALKAQELGEVLDPVFKSSLNIN